MPSTRHRLAFAFLAVVLTAVLISPFTQGATFSNTTEIRHHQVVFYLTALQQGDVLQVNCSTYFNSTIQMLLFDTRPTDEAIYSNGTYKPGFIDSAIATDIQDNPNASITYVANETKIYYLEFIQQNDQTDFLVVNSNQNLTQYYIPFLPGYPVPVIVGVTAAGIVIVWQVQRRRFAIAE
jgi:hypothetical protein